MIVKVLGLGMGFKETYLEFEFTFGFYFRRGFLCQHLQAVVPQGQTFRMDLSLVVFNMNTLG